MHTPSPWHVGRGGNLHANRVWTADMRPITNLCSMGMSPADIDPEAQANARLIAAAPELLEALHALVMTTVMLLQAAGWPRDKIEVIIAMQQARAALRKALEAPADV